VLVWVWVCVVVALLFACVSVHLARSLALTYARQAT
jgi:hypothetical protein